MESNRYWSQLDLCPPDKLAFPLPPLVSRPDGSFGRDTTVVHPENSIRRDGPEWCGRLESRGRAAPSFLELPCGVVECRQRGNVTLGRTSGLAKLRFAAAGRGLDP